MPPGRNGFQPQLSLVYSTGAGNGPFGLGWSLSIPGVSRKTSNGVPRNMELVDLHGGGLLDILAMNGVVRYWRNLGNGRFDMPRPMRDAPPHALADPGVQLIDANGDGRIDLLVTSGPLAGYYPLTHAAAWDRTSFQKYQQTPSFTLDDPEVRLVDLTGVGDLL